MEIITNKFNKNHVNTFRHENRTRIIKARQTEEKKKTNKPKPNQKNPKDSRFNQKTR